ncbi:hypothetical protein CGLO_14382 [Colletotrichum gloeosporioides Cg-14]|uniref:Uncharacterized protein n=1 Tax=Colletotrichum gloeosporioides (strain Cg-14) TaxID=1237896 RepID=T0K1E5_COLGC|nr:hypothetical protein CGLO_14382 [Colletotrichum gloeosporioides Cg-14]
MDKVKRGFSWKKSESPNNSRDNADSSSDGIPKIRRQVTLPPPPSGWIIQKVSAYNLEWDHLRKWLINRFKDDGKGFNEKQAIDEDYFIFYSPKRLTEVADLEAIESLRKRSREDIERLEGRESHSPDPLPAR